jgi:hypothetical protein
MSKNTKGKKKTAFDKLAEQLNKPDTWIRSDLGLSGEPPMNVRSTGAKKTDTGKRRFNLLPVQPLYDAIDVLEFGAKRYGDFNWQKGFEWSGLYNAAQRHMYAWLDGEDNADDSGLNHLSHAMVNLMFLLVFRNTHKELDDRVKQDA